MLKEKTNKEVNTAGTGGDGTKIPFPCTSLLQTVILHKCHLLEGPVQILGL